MLKEQFLEAAMKALSQAYEAKERVKETLNSDVVQSYLQGVKDLAINILEKTNKGSQSQSSQAQESSPAPASMKRAPKRKAKVEKIKIEKIKIEKVMPEKKKAKEPAVKKTKGRAVKVAPKISTEPKEAAKKGAKKAKIVEKTAEPIAMPVVSKETKGRKSSIKPAKEIGSPNAEKIAKWLKSEPAPKLKKNDAIDGKKSLAYLVWALGHAERANIKEGISIHDVSALLFKMNKIELYPINFSRVVHSNMNLVNQVGQSKRTKTYLLTKEGKSLFETRFLKA